MVVVHGGHAQQHEDDGLAAGGQHLHRVLDGGVRLGRHVGDDVVLHRQPAKSDAAASSEVSEAVKPHWALHFDGSKNHYLHP